jgi:hypothetical protein
MARQLKKDSSPSLPAKSESVSIKALIEKHADLTMRLTFVQAVLEITKENFGQHDGLEPKNLVVTSDGRKVHETTIESTINDMERLLLKPLQDELKKLESRRV